ncbi:uncharacterized protein J8A68_003529 [[Candida] subhashii]|uniref:tRNase Z endonuclease domain-containing protein n=1 Tax=[Candida] subhashii TaxID=561895 RepID=A0A8J5Q8Q2_9ASCO|nr:uncharacterized protein J8A68_003529 [[Candida] subhashii]KAG7662939.1 hypothetical protein J8A68_003529 [[Candida] subhashii]
MEQAPAIKQGQINLPAPFCMTTLLHLTDETARPLISLSTHKGRYLFGKVPEGSQRILNTFKLRYNNLKGIFLSGTINSWTDIGGLAGLFLTISDGSSKDVNVFGNRNLIQYIIATWRHFVFRKGVKINITDPESDLIHDGEEVNIFSIKIPRDKPTHTTRRDRQKIHNSALDKLISCMFPMDTSIVNSKDPESYTKIDPSLHTYVDLPPAPHVYQSQESYSYLIRILPAPGKFNPKEAIALGVKPGPLFRQLQLGSVVLNEAGEEVHPHQVMGESRKLSKVLVVDIPNNFYYGNTIKCKEWFIKDEKKGDEDIGLVYHFLGADVDFNLEKYTKDFLCQFPQDTQHVISHPSMTNNTILNIRSSCNILTLKSLMNENFNVINSEPYVPLNPNDRITRLHALQTYCITYDGIQPDTSAIFDGDSEQIYKEKVIPSLEPLDVPIKSFSELANKKIDFSSSKSSSSLKDQVQVITLGTGSSLPTASRNVTGNLVRIPFRKTKDSDITFRSVLLDGGEATLGNLKRMVGPNGSQELLKELSLIFLSHLHADHHLGIVSVINEWFEVNHDDDDARLHLIVPDDYIMFLEDWYSLEENYHKFYNKDKLRVFSAEAFVPPSRATGPVRPISLKQFERIFDSGEKHDAFRVPVNVDTSEIYKMYEYIGLKRVELARAHHCAFSYSSVMKYKLSKDENFIVSYSGDTAPNPYFAYIGYGTDLLIHEATFANSLAKDAYEKKHSTMIEAIHVALCMNCPKIILTHFSSRFANTNNCIKRTRMKEAAEHVEHYMKNMRRRSEIFDFDIKSNPLKYSKTYDNLEIYFAYDLMSVRYSDIKLQEKYWDIFDEIFTPSMFEREVDENFEEEGVPPKDAPAKRQKITDQWY